MDEMTAFERELVAELGQMAGPGRRVDGMAMVRTVASESAKWRFGSMFSATKFFVAGAIVALFGGFLLAGALTQQPADEPLPPAAAAATSSPEADAADQSVRSDLLQGVDLVVEEVETGVFQVLSDGAGHDLVAEPPGALTFAPDGDLVLFSGDVQSFDRFFVLGQEGEQAMGHLGGGDPYWFDAAIDHDGNLIARLSEGGRGWALGGLALFDGDSWLDLRWPNGSIRVGAVEVGPDGAAWVTRTSDASWPRIARIEDGVLTVLRMADDGTSGRYLGTPDNLAVAPDGTVWFASNDGSGSPLPKDTKGLLRSDGETWLAVDVPIDPAVGQFGPLAIGPDGTLWVYAVEGPYSDEPPHLLRFHDAEWSVFTEADGVPSLVGARTFGARLAVDGEGTVWIAFDGDYTVATLPPPFGPSDGPHGVLSFDGSTWRQYLKGHAVNRLDVADDGSVWGTSLRECDEVPVRRCGGGLFLIDPDAVGVE